MKESVSSKDEKGIRSNSERIGGTGRGTQDLAVWRSLGESIRSRRTPTGQLDSSWTLGIFSILIGLLSAVLSGYLYGGGSQVVHLLEIFRAIDPDYLANDFWLNSASQFGPRFYYMQAIALAGHFLPVPTICFLLFVFARVTVSVCTAFMTRDLSQSTVAALIVAVVAVSVEPFYLGHSAGSANAVLRTLTPHVLIEPFVLFALWRGIRGEPVCAAAAGVPAILLHPTLGVSATGVALIAVLSRCLWLAWPHCPPTGECARFILSLLLVGITTGLFWIMPALVSGAIFSPSMETDEFVHVLAYVRHPHHLIPSTWPLQNFGEAAAFAAAALIALAAFRRASWSTSDPREHLARVVAVTAIFVVTVFCFFTGWLFVEVVPTRWAATAYFYRLVRVFAWVGWVLVAASIAEQFALKNLRWAALGLVSVFSAPALLLYQAVLSASVNGTGTARRSTPFFVAVAALALVTVFIFHRSNTVLFVAVVGMGVTAAITIFPRLAPACMVAMAIILILAVSVFALHRSGLLPESTRIRSVVAHLRLATTLNDFRERHGGSPPADLAAAARSRTEPDAVFLVPVDWHRWRLLAQRAVVVDWRAFPFREEGMREWHRRYLTISDIEHGAGYPDNITEAGLRKLQERWSFHYAVVPSESDFPFPVVAMSGEWKLVHVADVHLRNHEGSGRR